MGLIRGLRLERLFKTKIEQRSCLKAVVGIIWSLIA